MKYEVDVKVFQRDDIYTTTLIIRAESMEKAKKLALKILKNKEKDNILVPIKISDVRLCENLIW